MKRISLTQGKFALIDDIDFEYLNQWKWHYHDGYAAKGCSPTILMHRIVAKRAEINCSQTIDHINLKRNDNRRKNLRPATKAQQMMNYNKQKNNTSGFKGVSYCKRHHKWRATIRYKHHYHLGYFNNKLDAAKAYNKAAKKYFGKFARLNKI